jgi:hypothetical protein
MLKRLAGKAFLPQLLASGGLEPEIAQGVNSDLAISPMGQLLGDDTDPEEVCTIYRDVAAAIKELHDIGIVHWWDMEWI